MLDPLLLQGKERLANKVLYTVDTPSELPIPEVKHSQLQQQEIYQRNSQESRLLALPPELQWQIFRLVLTNQHIHIRSVPDGLQAFQLPQWEPPPDYKCRNDASHFPWILSGSLEIALQSNEHVQRTDMVRLTPIWRTSKQMYHETIHLVDSDTNSLSFEIANSNVLAVALQDKFRSIDKYWITDLYQLRYFYEFLRLSTAKGKKPRQVKEIRVPTRLDRLRKQAERATVAVRLIFDADAEQARVDTMHRSLAGLDAKIVEVQT